MSDQHIDAADLDAAFAGLRQQVGDGIAMPAAETVVARSRRRDTVRTAVVGCAALAVLVAGGAAVRAGQRPDPPPGPVAATGSPTPPPVDVGIPSGFLLYEAVAAADPAALEHRAELPGKWPPSMCFDDTYEGAPAESERWLVFDDHARPVRVERLAVFADAAAADTAFEEVRAEASRCSDAEDVRTPSLGDEALRVRRELPEERFTWTLFVRRGAAIAEYDGNDRGRVERDAAAMTAKMCRYQVSGC
jgi:hypothetical protein